MVSCKRHGAAPLRLPRTLPSHTSHGSTCRRCCSTAASTRTCITTCGRKWQVAHAPACLQLIVRNHNSRHGAVVHNCSRHVVAPLAPPWLRYQTLSSTCLRSRSPALLISSTKALKSTSVLSCCDGLQVCVDLVPQSGNADNGTPWATAYQRLPAIG